LNQQKIQHQQKRDLVGVELVERRKKIVRENEMKVTRPMGVVTSWTLYFVAGMPLELED